MGFKYILTVIFYFLIVEAEAQVSNTFREIDSMSYSLYQQEKWQELVAFGKGSIGDGIDFPYLRLRMGYAAFMMGNYSKASEHYRQVLLNDSYNQTAHYYIFLCQKYLNRSLSASYEASFLDPETQQKEKLTRSGITEFSLETSLKYPDDPYRGNGIYTHAGISNRMGWKWKLEQSIAYFNQRLSDPQLQPGPGRTIINDDKQLEYYAKFNYVPSPNWSAFGAYHYLNSNVNGLTYQNHIGILGLKYSRPYFDVQADADLGQIMSVNVNQYNLQFGIYPLGNLNFYLLTRGSYQQQGDIQRSLFSGLSGFRISRNCWLEASVTVGELDNFLEREGLYVYNSVDLSKSKSGGSILFTLDHKTTLQFNYTYEKKLQNLQNNLYNQHSITGGIVWKF